MDYVHNESWREGASLADNREIPPWKRALDITLVLLALPVLVPVMGFIAVLIALVSDGPVLFRQERVGYRGRRFRCFKFRTMVVGDNTAVHQGHLHELMTTNRPMVKMDAQGDPRIIPCGLPLRSSGLDELPQIINVLRGDMSLVGPRPCVPYEYEKYLPWQKERFNTLPGLTGLWQVSGKNKTTFEEMIQLDIRYVRTKSPWLDLAIIFKTIPALVVQVIEVRRDRKSLGREVRPQPARLDRAAGRAMAPSTQLSRKAFISMKEVKTQEKS
jgi:lipopolysaccharide/colanic/teichoic acid biosynthesis glycosyltransferase